MFFIDFNSDSDKFSVSNKKTSNNFSYEKFSIKILILMVIKTLIIKKNKNKGMLNSFVSRVFIIISYVNFNMF